MEITKVPRLAYSHVDRKEGRSLTKVARDQRLSWRRTQVEVSIRCTNYIRRWVVAIGPSRRECWTFSKDSISISVLYRPDVERPSGTGNYERIPTHSPPRQVDRTGKCEPVSHVKRSAAK